ncbi:MAG TPA: ATP phosphoribosyltransferase regulatory subunit [Thermoanaerobaculia bacterium]|nr:ATP phosphoribosyltransferase regulatory subunit [Thermoanaerobaculia bacterium]
MRLAGGLPRGVSALLFDAARRVRGLESRLAAELEAEGYAEALLPIFDEFEPYEPLLPAGARSEIYRFAGRSGEMLALRSDFTPMLARLIAPHLPSLELPLRLFYRGDVVRAESGAAEIRQIGGELLGAGPEGAGLERQGAESFARLVEIASGGRARLVLGLAGGLDELLLETAGAGGAPGLARSVARRELGAARAAGSALAEIVETGVPADPSRLGRAARELERLEALAADLATAHPRLGIAVDLAEFADFSRLPGGPAARDLRPYYEGLVVRAYLPGSARPVAGGGRYDRLFRALGADVAAVGFSLALEPFALGSGR